MNAYTLQSKARSRRCAGRILAFLLTAVLFSTADSSAQFRNDPEALSRRLTDINERLRIAGERDDHPEVESCMDTMIDLMQQLEVDHQIVQERAQLRIQYSISVNRLRSARDAALEWLETYPDDFAVREMLGTIYENMGLDAKAEEQIKAVYEADPTDAEKQREYLQKLMLGTDREKVFKLCERILQTNGKNVKCLINVAEAYLHFRDLEQAAKTVDRIQQVEPDRPYIEYARGKIHQESGEFEQAAAVFKRIEKGHPDWFNSHYRLGTCLFRMRQYEDAAYVLVEVLTADPYHTGANARLEQVLRRLRKREGARVLYDLRTGLLENIELIELEALGYKRRGMLAEQARLEAIILDDKRQYRSAESLLESACKSLPDSIEAQENLAEHHMRTVQACRAEEIYRKLERKFPPAARGRITIELAKSMLRQGKAGETAAILSEASSDSEFAESLRTLLGTYYLEIEGSPAKALSYLEKVDSVSPEVKAAHARSLMGVAEFDRAWEIFEKIPSAYDDPVCEMAKVECLAHLNRVEDAKSQYQNTLDKHPDLSPFIRVPVEAALAELEGASNTAELNERAAKLDASLRTVRELVVEANREGWPDSVPTLCQLSHAYLELGLSEESLKYAQLAWQGDFSRTENFRKVIERMTQPEHVFERLHDIALLKSRIPDSPPFKEETAEALAHLELSSAGF